MAVDGPHPNADANSSNNHQAGAQRKPVSQDAMMAMPFYGAGLLVGIIGALIMWILPVNKGKSTRDLKYEAFLGGLLAPLLLAAAEFVPSLVKLRAVAAGLIIFLTADFTENASRYELAKLHPSTAGCALLIIGMWVAALGLINPRAAAAGLPARLQTPGNMLGLISAGITFLGCILCWAADDALKHNKPFIGVNTEALLVGQVAFLNLCILIGIIVFGNQNQAITISLFVSGFLLIYSLNFAVSSDYNYPEKQSKQGIGIAGGVFVWIGQLMQIVALAVLPGFMSGPRTGPAPNNSHNNIAAQQQTGQNPA